MRSEHHHHRSGDDPKRELAQLERFLRLGKGCAPDWLTDMKLAEKWHIPPWQIEAEAPLVWVARENAVARIRNKQIKES